MVRYFLPVWILVASFSSAMSAELVIVEQVGCEWCQLWDEEIGEIYNKTEEGKRAPLVRHDIDNISNLGYELETGVRYTPTFIVIDNNKEVGRIAGYPGQDNFWPMLNRILDQLPIYETR